MKNFLKMFVLMISLISVQWVSGQTVTMNPTTANICAGSGTIATFTAVPTGGVAINYAWSNGITGIDYIDVSPAINTTYTVTVTFIGGTTATATGSVTVLPSPVPTISTSGSTNICAGNSVTLTSSLPNCQWYLNGSQIPGATMVNYPASVAGAYRVYATVGTCSGMSTTTTVVVNPLPVASFTPNILLDECNDAITPFSADLVGPNYSYQWHQSIDGTPGSFFPMPGEIGPTLISDPGDFFYSVTITNLLTTCTSSWLP
jgi:hypothetical protein